MLMVGGWVGKLPLLGADDLTNETLTEVGVIAVNVGAEKRSTFSRVLANVRCGLSGSRPTERGRCLRANEFSSSLHFRST